MRGTLFGSSRCSSISAILKRTISKASNHDQYFNKIFGIGVGNYGEVSHTNYYQNKKKINDYDILPNTHPHQYHFEILATLGLSGYIYLTIFFIYFLFKNFKFYLKTKNKLNLGSLVMVFVILFPLIPTGSFFTTYGASIFWLNFALMNLGNINNIK